MSTSYLFKKVDSGDYIAAKRRMTISKEYINAKTVPSFNPVKTNGLTYNKNFLFIPKTNGTNCLINANSFELLNNYNVGTNYINQICSIPIIPNLDLSFNSGGSGFNSYILFFDLAIQSDDKIIAGGNFTMYNGTNTCNYIARLNADGTFDNSFNIGGSGFNGAPSGIVLQSNSKIVIGGGFNLYNDGISSYNCNSIVRLNSDGTFDTTFNSTGTSFDNTVSNIALDPSGEKIIVGGNFTIYDDGTAHACNSIARLNIDGTFDTGFINGVGTGFNQALYNSSFTFQQPNNKIVIGGSFTSYNDGADYLCNYIARLNTDGTFDTTFNNNGTSFDQVVNCVVTQSDGKLICGGSFQNYNDIIGDHPCSYIARLNIDGTFDTGFNIGSGFTGGSGDGVYSLKIQPDGKIIAGGSFTNYNGLATGYIARLNTDGSLDTTFRLNSGSGFNSDVTSLGIQSTGNIIVGGFFQHFSGTPVGYIARLYS